jgi:hypothetical protein
MLVRRLDLFLLKKEPLEQTVESIYANYLETNQELLRADSDDHRLRAELLLELGRLGLRLGDITKRPDFILQAIDTFKVVSGLASKTQQPEAIFQSSLDGRLAAYRALRPSDASTIEVAYANFKQEANLNNILNSIAEDKLEEALKLLDVAFERADTIPSMPVKLLADYEIFSLYSAVYRKIFAIKFKDLSQGSESVLSTPELMEPYYASYVKSFEALRQIILFKLFTSTTNNNRIIDSAMQRILRYHEDDGIFKQLVDQNQNSIIANRAGFDTELTALNVRRETQGKSPFEQATYLSSASNELRAKDIEHSSGFDSKLIESVIQEMMSDGLYNQGKIELSQVSALEAMLNFIESHTFNGILDWQKVSELYDKFVSTFPSGGQFKETI